MNEPVSDAYLGAAGPRPGPLIDLVADWLMAQALDEVEVESILRGCSERLRASGIPLSRAALSYTTLHPLLRSVSLRWYRDGEMNETGHAHGADTEEQWLRSPLYHMVVSRIPYLRRRLTGPDALLDFPVLEELRAEGATDYLGYAVPFASSPSSEPFTTGVVGSWATDRAGGFSAVDVAALLRIQQRVGVAVKMQVRDQIAANVVATYLGPVAGRRVLDGSIRRGDGEDLHAVIWYSDMRGSTRLADAIERREFLDLLNRYFECTAGAVLAHGGEVLRFIGDAVLAIFPVHGDRGDDLAPACAAALAAAREAERRLAEANAELASQGRGPLDFGLGLHVGELMFGNIGVPERLEFSVIGAAANEVARIEAHTKVAGRRVLASAAVADAGSGWESIGRVELDGVARGIELFTPVDRNAGSSAVVAGR